MQIMSPREQISSISYQIPGTSISGLRKMKRNVPMNRDGENEEANSWKDRLQE